MVTTHGLNVTGGGGVIGTVDRATCCQRTRFSGWVSRLRGVPPRLRGLRRLRPALRAGHRPPGRFPIILSFLSLRIFALDSSRAGPVQRSQPPPKVGPRFLGIPVGKLSATEVTPLL